MLPYKSKYSLRHNLPKKPKNRDSNSWQSHCGVGGFTDDRFHFYDGKGPTVSESCAFQSGDIVNKLCETFPRIQDFTIYFDNWFTFKSFGYSSRIRVYYGQVGSGDQCLFGDSVTEVK